MQILNYILNSLPGIATALFAMVAMNRTRHKDYEVACDKKHQPLREAFEELKDRQEKDRQQLAQELIVSQQALSGNFAELRHGIDGLIAKDSETKAMIAGLSSTVVELKDQMKELGRRFDRHCEQKHE